MSHFLYMITVETGHGLGPVKIGISRNPGARLADIQTSCPYLIKLIHVFEVPDRNIAADIERCFLTVMAKHKTIGEWFSFDPITALRLMCACFRAMFQERWSNAEPEIMAQVEDRCGLIAAEAKIAEWLRPPEAAIQ